MISSSPAKAAILAAAFAFSPVIAQGEPENSLPNEAREAIGNPAPADYEVAIDNNMDVIGQYLHQQPAQPEPGYKAYALGWIEWSRDMIVSSANHAGNWFAARSQDTAEVTHDAYEWLSAHSGFMAAAAYDAGEWVSETSEDVAESAQETTDWIAAETTVAAHAAAGTVTKAIDGMWVFEDWSEDFVDEVKKKLQEDKTSKFAKLVSESGFVITNVVVGVGLIPSLDVEFRHERDLSEDELATFENKVKEYAEQTSGLIGYLETVLLRNLARAGHLSEGLRIGELHVDLFPLPGLAVLFDPFHVEKERDRMIVSSDAFTKDHASQIGALELRIEKLEAAVAAARSAVTTQ